ncbi:type IV secretory system conjugative DNA transfer family protein [Streptomyces sp. NPDC096136]|uniref:type IV secretory system conjugative DNA transfer family protein n=1 Tax=Streptomyces sp. NPDC096136 TaxID=3366076 RepID=UPI00382BC883
MSATNKPRGPGGDSSPYLLIGACAVVLAAAAVAWTSAAAGAALSDRPRPPKNPFALLIEVATGDYTWPGTWATVVLVLELLAVATIGVFAVRAVRGYRARLQPIDAAARHMGKGKDLARISKTGAQATADRLGSQAGIGVFIGRTVLGRQPLYGTVEDTHVDIWGPRTGKTTRKAIPAIMDHGAAPAFVTSNKRDVVDATRRPRAGLGRVWVFDPQQIIGEAPDSWWWNPLSYVTSVAKAEELAGHFAMDSRGENASTDAHFEPAGMELLANLLLAAALDHRPITQVYSWLSDQRDYEPEGILRQAGADYALSADSVRGTLDAADKERSGVFSTARRMAAILRNPEVTRWVTPNGDDRDEFDPVKFASSSDTMYLISREGAGSAGALVTALSVALCDAAERTAMHSPGGRLSRPMLGVLDEAANVCKWANLPALYSHYGSRGIELMTILQSWDQGVEVWGERGMGKLWSSANVATYGGGVKDPKFLGDLSSFIKKHEATRRSVTRQPGPNGGGLFSSGRSTTISTQQEETLDVADLLAVGSGRAIVLASQTPAVLVETVPWWEREWAAEVQASLDMHDPGGKK